MRAAMEPSWSLRVLLLASLLLLSSALQSSPPNGAGRATPRQRPPELSAGEVARMCDPRGSHPGVPLSWCHELRLRRRRGGGGLHRPPPLPPPGHDGGEEVDMRYGVAKRLVPTGPNPLHN